MRCNYRHDEISKTNRCLLTIKYCVAKGGSGCACIIGRLKLRKTVNMYRL